jgi:uncharacterized OB-fold protein
MIEQPLLPGLDEESAPFFDFAARGELRIQACADCGVRRMPPRPRCDRCGSFEGRWDLMSGSGIVWSFVVPHPPLLPAYAEVAPYNVVLVELDDDPTIRLVGNVVSEPGAALDSVDPSLVTIGMSVQVAFPDPVDDGEGPVVLPRWVPAGDR